MLEDNFRCFETIPPARNRSLYSCIHIPSSASSPRDLHRLDDPDEYYCHLPSSFLIRINERVEERIREHGIGSYMCVWFKEDEDTAVDSDIYQDYIDGQTDS